MRTRAQSSDLIWRYFSPPYGIYGLFKLQLVDNKLLTFQCREFSRRIHVKATKKSKILSIFF